MKTKHTPTPWRTLGNWAIVSQTKYIADLYRNGSSVEELDVIEANTSFIVRACNIHNELVEALMDLHPAIESLLERERIGKLIIKAKGE